MKTILLIAMTVAVPAFAADNPTAAKAEAAVKAAYAQIDACIAQNDPKCLGELLTNDVTFTSPALRDSMNAPRIFKGKVEVLKAVGKLMKDMPVEKGAQQKLSVVSVHLTGPDRAFVDASMEVSGMKVAPPGKSVSIGSMVLQDGKWLFQDIRSYGVIFPAPPTPGTPARSVTPAQSVMPAPPVTPTQPAEPAKP